MRATKESDREPYFLSRWLFFGEALYCEGLRILGLVPSLENESDEEMGDCLEYLWVSGAFMAPV